MAQLYFAAAHTNATDLHLLASVHVEVGFDKDVMTPEGRMSHESIIWTGVNDS